MAKRPETDRAQGDGAGGSSGHRRQARGARRAAAGGAGAWVSASRVAGQRSGNRLDHSGGSHLQATIGRSYPIPGPASAAGLERRHALRQVPQRFVELRISVDHLDLLPSQRKSILEWWPLSSLAIMRNSKLA